MTQFEQLKGTDNTFVCDLDKLNDSLKGHGKKVIALQEMKKYITQRKNNVINVIEHGDVNLMTFDDSYFDDIKKYSTNNK